MTGLVVLAQRVCVGRCKSRPRSCLAGEAQGNLTGSLVASLVQRRLFGMAVRLMLPREVAHPVEQSRKGLRRQVEDARSQMKKSKPREGHRQSRTEGRQAAEEIAARRTSE